MEAYITSERDIVVTFLGNLRSWYSEFLFERQLNVKASEDGTLLGVIDEVTILYGTIVSGFWYMLLGYQLYGYGNWNMEQERMEKKLTK